MDNVTNYWNVFASTGMIDDYMTYKKIEQINKTNSSQKISSLRSDINGENYLNK